MEQLTDEELIALCANGDRAAMDVLVCRYHPSVLELAMRHLRDREAAADVAQTCLVRVYQSSGSFGGKSSFRTWLYAIALNLIREECRRRQRRREALSSETAYEALEPELETAEDSAEEAAVSRMESAALWQAVERLPERHRNAIILRFRLDLSYEEIGEVMRAPSGTAKSWVHHALRKLKKSLGGEDQL